MQVEGDVIDVGALRASGVVGRDVKKVKVISSGAIERPVTLRGVRVTKGAREAIEKAGGKIED
jgi:large subunit ribosomal protein L15